MLVREVMSSPAVTVTAEAPLEFAVSLLSQHSVTMLPVVGAGGALAGVLSEADVVREVVPRDPRIRLAAPPPANQPRRVDELMISAPITVTADTDLAVAADLMTSTGLKSLPVLDDRRTVLGVVSRRDIVRVLARTDLDVETELDTLFHRVGTDWMVEVVQGGVTITGPSGPRQRAMAKAVADSVRGVRSVSVRTDEGAHRCP